MTEHKDGENWVWSFTEEDDPEVVEAMLSLADTWNLDPTSTVFNSRIVYLLTKELDLLENQEKCEHDWKCTKVGMMVSHYECSKCNKHDMKSG